MQNLMLDAIKNLKKLKAQSVDILFSKEDGISLNSRFEKLEKLTKAEEISISLRVSVNNHVCVLNTNNINSLKDKNFLDKAIEAAKFSPIIDISISEEELIKDFSNLDLIDNKEISTEKLIERAIETESLALSNSKISNSEGAEISHVRSELILAKSSGFLASFEKTLTSAALVLLSSDNSSSQFGYDIASAIYFDDLKSPEELAKNASNRAISKLGAKKIQSTKMPVIFDSFAAKGILKSFLNVVDASSVINGCNFLQDKIGKTIFNKKISITDNGRIKKGIRSLPFDADGVATKCTQVVENGILNSFLFNNKFAKIYKTKSTGHAASWESIATYNVWIKNGDTPVLDMVKSLKRGLLVTDLLGIGLDPVSGNYSQGASGILIENGELTYPVNEITLAGNFLEMMKNMLPASDLKIEFGADSPSLFIPDMVIGGL